MTFSPGADGLDLLISECGPRDGLQILSEIMPTEAKKRWIAALHAAGLREIEVCSFVPAKLMPQMADAAEIVAFARTLPGLTVLALVPNLRGPKRPSQPARTSSPSPFRAARNTASPMCARRGPDGGGGAAHRGVSQRPCAACAGGSEYLRGLRCTIAGPVSEDEVTRLCVALVEAGVDDSGLSDTTGMGNPAQVKRLFTRVIGEIGDRIGAAHMHNTRGLGLANVLAAYEAGVRIFDSSHAGLGGCPHAPGASGNVVTEDLVFMFEAMGLRTGIDAAHLVESRAILAETLPDVELYGMLAGAGLPKGYQPATPVVHHAAGR